jgi:hypothetical protein
MTKPVHKYNRQTPFPLSNRGWQFLCPFLILAFLLIIMSTLITPVVFADADDTKSGAKQMNLNTIYIGNSLNYSTDRVDWWVLYSDGGKLKFTLDVPSGQDFDIEVYNSSNAKIGYGSNGPGSDEVVTVTIDYCGPCYIKVYTYGSSYGSYSLQCDFLRANSSPSLSGGSVSPSSGTTSTTFTYQVTYSDADCDAPDRKDVVIDGSSYRMTPVSGDYRNGKVYKYDKKLSAGKHNFYFSFNDGQGGSAVTSRTYKPSVTNGCPPQITIDAPRNNDTVKGLVTITTTATDSDDAVIQIQYYVNGSLAYTDNAPKKMCPSSQWTWDTRTNYPDGTYTIITRAWDFRGNSADASVSLKVQNNNLPQLSNGYVTPGSASPRATFTYYVTYKDADGDIPLVAQATINNGSSSWNLNMTPVNPLSVDYKTGVQYKVSTSLAIGNYSYYFYFMDLRGGVGATSVTSGPTVANLPPTVSITSPQANSTVSGIVSVQTSANEPDDSITKVEYYLDGGSLPVSTANNTSNAKPFVSKFDWNTSSYPYLNGSAHSIKAVAYNNYGEKAETTISVSVDNKNYISITHSPEPVIRNSTVTFSGKLSSGVKANRTVYIYSQEAGINTSVNTDSNGNFKYQWKPSATGAYYFRFGFVKDMCCFGDAFDVLGVVPGINKINSTTFFPSSPSVSQGSAVDLKVKTNLIVQNSGVIQVWITGNGVSKDAWAYINSGSNTTKELNFTISAPLKEGSSVYNVYTQFRPDVNSGPLKNTERYDTYSVTSYTIKGSRKTVTKTIDIPQGYSTFALPFSPDNKSISSVFSTNKPRYVFDWDSATSSYRVYPKVDGYAALSNMEPGKGYIVYFDSARQCTFSDYPSSATKVTLNKGWNFVANSTGVDNLPVLAITINNSGNSYSLKGAVASGIIADGIYELKGSTWQLAKFLKLGRGYYIYANSSSELVISAIDGPYLTNVTKDSFSGYVAGGNGNMQLTVTVPSGTTKINAKISGSGISGADLYLYDPSGSPAASQKGSSTTKEVVINNPMIGDWRCETRCTISDDRVINGNIYVTHPVSSQYVAASAYNKGDGTAGWLKCVYGAAGYGDKYGTTGLACDLGPNTVGFIPIPLAAIADEFVDGFQIAGTCVVGPIAISWIKSDLSYFGSGEYWFRCGANLIALIPYIGDASQATTKLFLKNLDDVVKPILKKSIKVALKNGETIDNLPDYFKLLDANKDNLKNFKSPLDFTYLTKAQVTGMAGNAQQLGGEAGEQVIRQFDKEFINVESLIKSDTPSGTITEALKNTGVWRMVNGKALGIGSYNSKTMKISSENIFVKKAGIANPVAVQVATDEAFIHNGRLYFKEIKTFTSENNAAKEWSAFVDKELNNLKDIKNTFETEFGWKGKVDIIVQSAGIPPPAGIIKKLHDAGIRVVT